MTGLFSFVSSGYFSQYQHLVCKQTELSLRLFEATTCEVYSDFHPELLKLSLEWPLMHRIRGVTSEEIAKASFFSIQTNNA